MTASIFAVNGQVTNSDKNVTLRETPCFLHGACMTASDNQGISNFAVTLRPDDVTGDYPHFFAWEEPSAVTTDPVAILPPGGIYVPSIETDLVGAVQAVTGTIYVTALISEVRGVKMSNFIRPAYFTADGDEVATRNGGRIWNGPVRFYGCCVVADANQTGRTIFTEVGSDIPVFQGPYARVGTVPPVALAPPEGIPLSSLAVNFGGDNVNAGQKAYITAYIKPIR
jgi:hypothetical protein